MRVLIVDDNVGFARLLRDHLKPDGVLVFATPDPAGARASARANQPTVLLVDAELPDGGAARALAGIAEVLTEPCHLLILTDESPETDDVQELVHRFGAADVLRRPVPMLDFPGLLRAACQDEPGFLPAAARPATDKPVAPWDVDPNWGLDHPRPQVRTTVPVRDDPTLTRRPAPAERGMEPRPTAPWERDPTWGAPPPAPRAPRPATTFRATPEVEVEVEPARILNLAILRTLTRLWARRLSGTIQAEGHPGSALFAEGAPADVMSEIFVKEALESRLKLSFRETRHEPNHRRADFAKLLWRTALELADADFVLRQGDKALEDCAFLGALTELPVHKDLQRLAQSADPYLSVQELIDALDSQHAAIGLELSALERLGLFRFDDVRKAKARKDAYKRALKPAPMPDLLEDRPGRRSGRLRAGDDTVRGGRVRAPEPEAPEAAPTVDPQRTIKKLRDERNNLARADVWTILGIPPTDDAKAIRTAADRMLYRLHAILDDDSQPDEARELAEELASMVDRAARESRPQAAKPTTQHGQAFEQGLRAARLGDWDMAVRSFRAALKRDMNNPRYMGWQGWAHWQLATTSSGADAARHRDDGLELLRLSDTFDSSDDEVQLFLARAELDMGNLDAAQGRAGRVHERSPRAEGLAELIRDVERAKRT